MPASLDSLPMELHLQILPYLDYRSQTNLRACSRYYRSLPQMSRKDLTSLLFATENISEMPWFSLNGFLPCYHCLRMRPEPVYSNWAPLFRSYECYPPVHTTFRMCRECQGGHNAEQLDDAELRCAADYPCWERLYPGKNYSSSMRSSSPRWHFSPCGSNFFKSA